MTCCTRLLAVLSDLTRQLRLFSASEPKNQQTSQSGGTITCCFKIQTLLMCFQSHHTNWSVDASAPRDSFDSSARLPRRNQFNVSHIVSQWERPRSRHHFFLPFFFLGQRLETAGSTATIGSHSSQKLTSRLRLSSPSLVKVT